MNVVNLGGVEEPDWIWSKLIIWNLQRINKEKSSISFIVPYSLKCESWVLCSFHKVHLYALEISYSLNLGEGFQPTALFPCFYFFKFFYVFLSFMSNDSLLIWKDNRLYCRICGSIARLYLLSIRSRIKVLTEVYRDYLIDYLEMIAKFFTLLFLGHFMFCYMKVIMKLNCYLPIK